MPHLLQEHGSECFKDQVRILPLPPALCVALGKLLSFSVPQFPLLYLGDDDDDHCTCLRTVSEKAMAPHSSTFAWKIL